MRTINTKFKGLKIIKQVKFKDKRGYLRIIYNQKLIKNKNFVFEYCTNSKKIHYVVFIFNINISRRSMLVLLKVKS